MRTYRQVGPAVATGMNIAVNEILRGGGVYRSTRFNTRTSAPNGSINESK